MASDNRLVEIITQICVSMKRFRNIDFNKRALNEKRVDMKWGKA